LTDNYQLFPDSDYNQRKLWYFRQYILIFAAADRMSELSDVFGGKTPLTRVEKNETLQRLRHRKSFNSITIYNRISLEYFQNLSTQIGALDFTDSTSAGRKITHLQSVRVVIVSCQF
jgi:hypothetical protein